MPADVPARPVWWVLRGSVRLLTALALTALVLAFGLDGSPAGTSPRPASAAPVTTAAEMSTVSPGRLVTDTRRAVPAPPSAPSRHPVPVVGAAVPAPLSGVEPGAPTRRGPPRR